jgi:hypothetical protein
MSSARERDLPGTLKRSPKKAQDTYAKAHDVAGPGMTKPDLVQAIQKANGSRTRNARGI